MNSTQVLFNNRPVEIDFNPAISNFGGLPFVIQCLEKANFRSKLSSVIGATLPQQRESSSRFKLKGIDLVWQRLLALICGCEDLNDFDASLPGDPLFKEVLGGKELASSSTLCRFERLIEEETISKINEFLQDMYLRYGRTGSLIILDVDNTPVELYGHQENCKFNGHYGCNCYLPLAAFCNGFPVAIINGNEDGRKTMVNVLRPIVEKLRSSGKHPTIVLRADSGFNSTALVNLCEELGIFYLIGLAPNKRLTECLDKLEPEFMEVLHRGHELGSVLRHFGEIEDYQAESWNGPRRVIARDYWNDERRDWNARFIQTNIPKVNDPERPCRGLWKKTAQELYDDLYCARGLAEKHNQEFKKQTFGARASSTRFLTNSYRMALAALCQLALLIVRKVFCSAGSKWKKVGAASFRKNFICIAAVVRKLKTKWCLTLTEGVPDKGELEYLWGFKT